MSRIPDFTQIDFADAPSPAAAAAAPWLTPEGLAVKSVYGADDLAGSRLPSTPIPASRLICAAPIRPCT